MNKIKHIGLLVVGIYVVGVIIAWRRLKRADIVGGFQIALKWPLVSTTPDRYQGSAE